MKNHKIITKKIFIILSFELKELKTKKHVIQSKINSWIQSHIEILLPINVLSH